MFVWRTHHGDGFYPVYRQQPRYGASQNVEVGTCSVDSGLLCIVPVEAIRQMNGVELEHVFSGFKNGVVLDATAIPEANGEGNVQFGGYRIVTDDVDEEVSNIEEKDRRMSQNGLTRLPDLLAKAVAAGYRFAFVGHGEARVQTPEAKEYVVSLSGATFPFGCSCPGYFYRNRCKHQASVEQLTALVTFPQGG